MGGMLQKLLTISPAEATFARRRFHCLRDSTRHRLERVGSTFLQGYYLAINDLGIDKLTERLHEIDLEFRRYGFEGAAMGLDILDQLRPWKAGRIDKFLLGPGKPHLYMVHVGIGWSMARWRFRMPQRLAHLDPLLRWLVLDGFGFHQGYFHWPLCASGASGAFPKLPGYSLRAFDQGLGRSLWFIGGADPEYIAGAILHFPDRRRNDLWSGIGLACAYAGGADINDIQTLRRLSGSHWPHLAQGAVFAAGARHRAGNPDPHTERACQLLVGVDTQQAAALCDGTLHNAVEHGEPAYEIWRQLIRTELKSRATANPALPTEGVPVPHLDPGPASSMLKPVEHEYSANGKEATR
jgi:hypothetical protein